jgi:tetratricopeptide (TPR) repeat protein
MQRKVRPWMLGYTVILVSFVIFIGLYSRHRPSHHHPIYYEVISSLSIILMFAGNFLYSFAYITPFVRRVWRFVFPVVVLSCVVGLIVSLYFDKSDHPTSPIAKGMALVITVALFLPSFRANFLLGYGSVDRVRQIPQPRTMSDDPLHYLVVEITKLRRTSQVAWIIAILLLGTLVAINFFGLRMEPKADSWVTVRRLADATRYEEALAVANRLVEKDPNSPQTHILMGTLQLSLGKLHQAEGSFTRAFELLPNENNASLLNAVRRRIDEEAPIPTPTPTP